MKYRWLVVGLALAAAASPALAHKKHPHKHRPHKAVAARCDSDRPYQFSWKFLIPGHNTPEPNGCAPPVYQYGQFEGQDPDPFIRSQLARDPWTGYAPP